MLISMFMFVHIHLWCSVNWNHLSNYIVSAGGDDAIVLYRHVAGSDGPLQLESKLEEAHMNDINSCRWICMPFTLELHFTCSEKRCEYMSY